MYIHHAHRTVVPVPGGIVDDELDNRVVMRYVLESWGYEVELAAKTSVLSCW